MRLPEFALRNIPFIGVMAFLLVGLGILSLLTMPRSEDPQIEFPITVTRVLYPGTNPIDMERLVVDPIEDAINELEDIKHIQTEISDGLVLIRTEFLYGSDADDKYEDVVTAIQSIADDLPDGLVTLETEKITPTDVNILQIALSSHTATTYEFKLLAEDLETRLERISGIKQVDIKGLEDLEVQVKADWVRLRQQGISLDELTEAVRRAASNLPGGYVNSEERRFTVRTSGDYKDLDTLRRTVVRSVDGQLVFVENLATVALTESLPTYQARYQGIPSVFVTVVQRKGTNIFDVMQGVEKTLEQFRSKLPDGMTLELIHNQSASVEERINGFFTSLWQGLLLVGLIVLAVLGLRASTVIILAIPFSILIGLGWLDVSQFSLQQMSIVGLVIALGLLVDNAIVVTENIERFLRDGKSPYEAAIQGTSQVGWAIVSGTLTTVLAFLPLLMLQNDSGTFIRSMPVTVILTLLASLLIALTITPILSARLLKERQSDGKVVAHSVVFWGIQSFARNHYSRSLHWALRHPLVILVISTLMLVGALSLVPQVGMSLFPKAEKNQILVDIETPEGSTFAATAEAARYVEQKLLGSEEVAKVATNIGKANPRVYYNTLDTKQQSNYAQLLVITETADYAEVEAWVQEQREYFSGYADAQVRFKEFLQGPPLQAPIAIRVVGDNLDDLRIAAQDVVDIIANTEGTVNYDTPISKHKVDLRVAVQRDKASIYQISLETLDRTVRAGLVGLEAGTLRDDAGEDYPILVSARQSEEPELVQFEHMVVANQQGELIPLKQLATIELESAVPRFQHYNLQRMARVTSDVLPGYQTEVVTNAVAEQLENYPWPDGITYQIGGEQENRKQAFSGLSQALLIAVTGIFAVLVMQFRSFRQPMVIFAALPFALVGAILGLFFSGYSFSFTAGVGLTSLVGIVVNNSIILVDYANQLREKSLSVTEAMIESGSTRLMPIILTTLTTIGGLLPLTLSGSSMWAPMGFAIIGGLLVSTLLTLYVVPVLYRLFEGRG